MTATITPATDPRYVAKAQSFEQRAADLEAQQARLIRDGETKRAKALQTSIDSMRAQAARHAALARGGE